MKESANNAPTEIELQESDNLLLEQMFRPLIEANNAAALARANYRAAYFEIIAKTKIDLEKWQPEDLAIPGRIKFIPKQ